MKNQENLLENGSFSTGNILPWQLAYGDPDKLEFRDYTEDKKVVLLDTREAIDQRIDAKKIPGSTHFRLTLMARGQQVPPEANKSEPTAKAPLAQAGGEKQPKHTLTALNVTVALYYAGGQKLISKEFPVSGGMQTFTHDYTFPASPDPLVGARVSCLVSYSEVPDYDQHSVWLTGLELIALN